MDELVYYTCTDQRAAQSEAEERFLARVAAAGVPIVPQVKLGQNWVFDAAVNGTRLLIEYHGDYWHNRPEVVERDARKQQWADDEGYLIVTVWERDEQADPDGELARVVDAYAQVQAFAAVEGNTSNTPEPETPPPPRSAYGDWRDRFLEQLAEAGIVREACLAAGVARKTAYVARKADEGFADDWKLALADAADTALATYKRRGFQQSDRAMEFFIKSRDPETFGERTGTIDLVLKYLDLTRLSDHQVEQLAAGLDPVRVLLEPQSPSGGGAPSANRHGA